jgi:hypothetical protein
MLLTAVKTLIAAFSVKTLKILRWFPAFEKNESPPFSVYQTEDWSDFSFEMLVMCC